MIDVCKSARGDNGGDRLGGGGHHIGASGESDLDRLALEDVRRLARESVDNLPLHELRRLTQARLSRGKVRYQVVHSPRISAQTS